MLLWKSEINHRFVEIKSSMILRNKKKFSLMHIIKLLPHAMITDRIPKDAEGNFFTLFVSLQGVGVPNEALTERDSVRGSWSPISMVRLNNGNGWLACLLLSHRRDVLFEIYWVKVK